MTDFNLRSRSAKLCGDLDKPMMPINPPRPQATGSVGTRLIVSLDAADCLDPEFVGGKASALAAMARCNREAQQ